VQLADKILIWINTIAEHGMKKPLSRVDSKEFLTGTSVGLSDSRGSAHVEPFV
jgi:hypothetical protein